ncbi:MAG: hypothetical protein FWG88_11070 [Oscillospiraceae bacterium]|nr:hypothetical protein [Oscillospiraceae bacterium]
MKTKATLLTILLVLLSITACISNIKRIPASDSFSLKIKTQSHIATILLY